jgi:hypothetical protein
VIPGRNNNTDKFLQRLRRAGKARANGRQPISRIGPRLSNHRFQPKTTPKNQSTPTPPMQRALFSWTKATPSVQKRYRHPHRCGPRAFAPYSRASRSRTRLTVLRVPLAARWRLNAAPVELLGHHQQRQSSPGRGSRSRVQVAGAPPPSHLFRRDRGFTLAAQFF